MSTEKMNFKISTGLKNILGKELITSEVVAVFELVKNSFDANAKNVSIDIDIDHGKICILDDGIGMSKEDILNKWLFVAYSEKKDVNERDGRKYVGAKGIGRFACDRLGEEITIITKTASEKKYNVLQIEWGSFEKNSLDKFENIPVFYTTQRNYKEIKKSGTSIIIENLRDFWDYDRIIKLKRSLEKLVNPFDSSIDMNIQLNVMSQDQKLKDLSANIKNTLFEALKEKTMYITAEFNDTIEVKLKDRGTTIYDISKKINDTGLDGIKICIYYLNQAAKNNFTRIMGIEPKNYGSIFIYKNNFRVYPYGEIYYDTLGLDMRKTQGYNRYLGNREVVGYISITDLKNRFIEVSSRDRGFIENVYYKILEELYMDFAHKPLEKYVQLVNWGGTLTQEVTISDIEIDDEKKLLPTFFKKNEYEAKINKEVTKKNTPTIEKMLTNAIEEENLSQQNVKELFKKSKEVIVTSKKTIQEQEKLVSDKIEAIQHLENQNNLLKTLSNEENILQAEITHHISKMSNELQSCVESIVASIDYKQYPNIMEELSRIKLIADKMKVFYQVILKGNFQSKGKTNVNLFEYFTFYFESSIYIKGLLKSKKIAIHEGASFQLADWLFKVDVYDISVIIDNLISNAVDLNASLIDVSFEKNKIIFFSNTKQVLESDIDKIFELGFSTKIGGTGIGLYQIQKIIKKYNWNISVENKEDGVQFIIKVR